MAIEASLVKKLREETGGGMMDCKKALTETDGDFEKAKDFLRKKGEVKAAGKASRAMGQGYVSSYIHHNGRIGVLTEISCETDFVAKTEVFQDFTKTICLQIAATSPLAVRTQDLPPETVEREKSIYEESEEVLAKPEKVRPKIVEGKMRKFFESCVLEEQTLVSDDKKKVISLVKEMIAKFGENISIVRFVRYELGETGTSGE